MELEKETLITTYKATGRSLLNYACPIFTPGLSDTNWDSLQTAQNNALRTATGCVKMTEVGHLHHETKVMPVKEHSYMLSQQHLLAMTHPSHPNSCNLNHRPPRQMRQTLTSKFGSKIRDLNLQNIEEDQAKSQLRYHQTEIHTRCVQETIEAFQANKVLQTCPPPINQDEKNLPRPTRSTLSQIRSGYSSYLNSYLHRINPTKYQENCPKCNSSIHNSQHLFNCPANPTDLTVTSLWENPVEAATFLGLETKNGPGDLDDND